MIYVGITDTIHREIFHSKTTPNETSKYLYAIGPFRTIKGASIMVKYGVNNPHCRTVDEAEKLKDT